MTEPNAPTPILARVAALLMRNLSEAETARAAELVTRVSMRVQTAYGVPVDSDPRSWSLIAAAVERGMRNPTGATSRSGGPFSESLHESMVLTAFTQDELAELDRLHGRARVGSHRLRLPAEYLYAERIAEGRCETEGESQRLTGVADDAIRSR